MSIRNLDALFKPRAVAVIGASERRGSVGNVVMRQLLAGGFDGPIMPVNPKRRAVAGVLCYPDVKTLPATPDLAVIATPPETVPSIIADLGTRGTRAAAVLTAGLGQVKTTAGQTVRQAMLEAARPHLLRILGPNTVGVLVPGIGLNASFAHVGAKPGKIALIAQSGALCTVMLDWAAARGIGFSHFISLGDSADVDFGDAIDYLAGDPDTRSILLYIEAVSGTRKFMSAARAAARNKPVIAIKAGRVAEGARAAASHTGALAGADDVYDAALRRAGVLRVYEIGELFDAVETLAYARPVGDGRLAILTNGGGPGVLAVDSFVSQGGALANLAAETIATLDAALPATWSRGNPVDIIGDAPGSRYREALERTLADPGVDAVLVMHSPVAVASAMEAAEVVCEVAAQTSKCVLTSWLGETAVQAPRRRFAEAGLPSYQTPEQAVRGMLHMVRYRANQAQLMETPSATAEDGAPDRERARRLIADRLASGVTMLGEADSKALLLAYGIPVATTEIVPDTDAAVEAAQRAGFPVVLKINSPDITHKTDVGGVALDLEDAAAVKAAAERMLARVRDTRPEARLAGFTVQPMIRRPGAYELIVGASVDATFGPTVLFGEGGTAVEAIGDRTIGLPPLNRALARGMIERTRIARRLKGYRDVPAADLAAVEGVIVALSQLVAEHGAVAEVDINPLLADAKGVIGLDARVRLVPCDGDPVARLAIRPYPHELEEDWTAGDGTTLLLRPIRPEDEPDHRRFLASLSPEDVVLRFFGQVRSWSHSELARLTQIDYDREMAFVAVRTASGGGREIMGVVRGITDPDNERCEYAIVVRSDYKGHGLGYALMQKLIRYLRDKGTGIVVGRVRADNHRMLEMVRTLGFDVRTGEDSHEMEVSLTLRDA
ncbi:MAG: bifunctional acetate--CoA ligase family protein/GNAT family N-acetyltransferase [Alphaproteobacteria bacterium]